MHDTDKIPELALQWIAAGRRVALATVIETWGSAPRQIGAQLLIDSDGNFEGSVSGGCVEGAVILEAQDAIADATPRLLEYGVSDNNAFSVGLACGGTIRILVQPVGPALSVETLRTIASARAARKPICYVVDLENFSDSIINNVSDSDATRIEESRFYHVHLPSLKFIVVGAVHIAQPLLQYANALGYQTMLIDPREGFAAQQRFPETEVICDYPDAALAGMELDARTAVVTLAHDPKIDDPAIEAALKAPVLYLGCLGSSRTHAKRLERLGARGYSPAQLDRIHGPVGLRIGAKTPAEIAISILSEVIATVRNGALAK